MRRGNKKIAPNSGTPERREKRKNIKANITRGELQIRAHGKRMREDAGLSLPCIRQPATSSLSKEKSAVSDEEERRERRRSEQV